MVVGAGALVVVVSGLGLVEVVAGVGVDSFSVVFVVSGVSKAVSDVEVARALLESAKLDGGALPGFCTIAVAEAMAELEADALALNDQK